MGKGSTRDNRCCGLLAIAKGIAQESSTRCPTRLRFVMRSSTACPLPPRGQTAPHSQYGPFVPFMVQRIINRARVAMAA